MSMTGGYLQVTGEQLQAMIDDPDSLDELLEPAIMGGKGLNVDKAWQGIHFVLTGDAWSGEPPLSNVVLGGTEIGEDLGYGPVRYLTPEEVAEVATALAPIDADEFANRYDPDELAGNDIYAFDYDHPDDELEYFKDAYVELRGYFQDASAKGNAMLVFLV
jgi:Domain of unknown function (DUF1877)